MQALETNLKKAVGNQILHKIYCRAVSSSTFAKNMEVGVLYVAPMCIYVSRGKSNQLFLTKHQPLKEAQLVSVMWSQTSDTGRTLFYYIICTFFVRDLYPEPVS